MSVHAVFDIYIPHKLSCFFAALAAHALRGGVNNAMASSSLLLVGSLSLWMLQTTSPVLQAFLPHISVQWPWRNDNNNATSNDSIETTTTLLLQVPVSQALGFAAGLLSYLAAYCLLWDRSGSGRSGTGRSNSGGRLSLQSNLLFLLFGVMVTYGHGMHAVCVMMEEERSSQANMQLLPGMAAYVDFLHRFVSHNMFVFGIYGLLALIMSVERDEFLRCMKMGVQREVGCKGSVVVASNTSVCNSGNNSKETENRDVCNSGNNSKETENQVLRAISHHNRNTVHFARVQIWNTNSGIVSFVLHWGWPLILGTYFSVFGGLTGTTAVTLLFYMFIYLHTIKTCRQLGVGLGEMACNDQLLVCGTVAKAAIVGMPVLLLWFKLMER